MASSHGQSTLEILPDEILLEVCKYLSCVEILQSLVGLNSRMTRMITQYRHHVSLHKATFNQSSYLCTHVLPQIGPNIRSLVIDCCYAVLQHKLFLNHFRLKMSIMFPRLEKITVVRFRHDHLLAVLAALHDLNHLVEIHIYGLFDITRVYQATVLQKLFQANNNRLTSIFIDHQSSDLAFNDIDCYLNILKLRIKMREVRELSSLFAAVHNVRYLDVIFESDDPESVLFDQMNVSSLLHLTDFQLECVTRLWKLEELLVILRQIPNVQTLSLFLSTNDERLVYANILLPLLPSTLQQFHYAVFYYPNVRNSKDETLVASWLPSHPVTCIVSESFWLIHTLPWHIARMTLELEKGGTMSSQTNSAAGYDRQVEQLQLNIDRNFTLARSLGVIAQCRRVRKILIWMNEGGDVVQEEQPAPSLCLPKLSRLTQVNIYDSIPTDLDHLSCILIASPNLLRLDLPSDCLIRLFENQQVCDLLRRRIKSLVILKATDLSQFTLSEVHVPVIAFNLVGLFDLYVDLNHLSASTAIESNEIMPSSMESMIVCLLSEFKKHKLRSLCVNIQPSEKMKTDPKQWLKDNTYLCEQQFDAAFSEEFRRLAVWM